MTKVALVTGCSEGGIGFALCEALAFRAVTVYATARSLDSMKALDHPRIKKLVMDVKNDDDIQQVLRTIMEAEGKIDLLFNNAGILAAGPLIDHTVDQFRDIYETNVVSLFRIVKSVVPLMAKRKEGMIVNIGSVVGDVPSVWTGVYDSSKAAVRSMTEVLAMECRPFNIKIMLAAPGSVRSKIIDKQGDYEMVPNTIYGAFHHNVLDRLALGYTPDTITVKECADGIVGRALSANPPSYFYIGGQTRLLRFLAWLPRVWAMSLMWRTFSKPAPKDKMT
ncbi:oxidoreductase [Crucibulum laeve]|uniref:Oxidoreductase n=1 Tax=Crucibulum laeve TaxID=68775 RepID=A0A5C3ME57_9AGAR|nr:oxidoreductase [Crucibulum laeve]